MIDENLVFVQLCQEQNPISDVELAMGLSASTVHVKEALRRLGDAVAQNYDTPSDLREY